MSSSIAIEYYNRKFGNNISAAFIHLVREMGEIAFAIENDKPGIARPKITEAVALLYYIGSKYNIDIEENMNSLYAKKIESLKKRQGNK
jgi:NTP pyrophosphatase (non-canonical NTP hydrolase)